MISLDQWNYLIKVAQSNLFKIPINSQSRLQNSPDNIRFQNYLNKLMSNEFYSFSKFTYLILSALDTYIPNKVYLNIQEYNKPTISPNSKRAIYIDILTTYVNLIINIVVQIEYILNIYCLILVSIHYNNYNNYSKYNSNSSHDSEKQETSSQYLLKYITTYLDMKTNILAQNLSLLLMSTICSSHDKFSKSNITILDYLNTHSGQSNNYKVLYKCLSSTAIEIDKCLDTFVCNSIFKTGGDISSYSKVIDFIMHMLWTMIEPYTQTISILIAYIRDNFSEDVDNIVTSLQITQLDIVEHSIKNLIVGELNSMKQKFL